MGAPRHAFAFEIRLHKLTSLHFVLLIPQHPHQLDERYFRQQVTTLDDTGTQEVAAGIVYPVADSAMHTLRGHHYECSLIIENLQLRDKRGARVPETGPGDNDPVIPLVRIQKVRCHSRVGLDESTVRVLSLIHISE